MRLIRGWKNLRSQDRGCAATIGNFDGVHRGHRAVLARLRQAADERGLPVTLIVFEPHPLEFLRPQEAPARLTGLRDKLAALRGLGIDRLMCLRFNRELAQMPAEAFVEDVLLGALGVRFLLLGDDFRFGRGRRGDFDMVRALGQDRGLAVERMSTIEVDGARASSTRIREALARADLAGAAALLGRPYSICGRVQRGEALGRKLGFPTANLAFPRARPPLSGIFVVNVRGLGEPRPAVASLGTRPTVDGTRPLLEVHLLDFDGDLYGRHLDVEFLQWLRAEERFDSLQALQIQIARDVESARAYFAASPSGGASTTG